jgi:hypothetical protein
VLYSKRGCNRFSQALNALRTRIGYLLAVIASRSDVEIQKELARIGPRYRPPMMSPLRQASTNWARTPCLELTARCTRHSAGVAAAVPALWARVGWRVARFDRLRRWQEERPQAMHIAAGLFIDHGWDVVGWHQRPV